MDIHFNCPHCGRSVSVDEKARGVRVICPRCAKGVDIPTIPSEVFGLKSAGSSQSQSVSRKPRDGDILLQVTSPPGADPRLSATIQEPTLVVVKDFDMSFGSMVVFMIKWAFAAIPAAIILTLVGFLALIFLAAIAAALK